MHARGHRGTRQCSRRLWLVVALLACGLGLGGSVGIAQAARADVTLTPAQLDRLHTITEWDITYTTTNAWTGSASRTWHGFGIAGPQTETATHTLLESRSSTAQYTVGTPGGQECAWPQACTPNLQLPLSVEYTHVIHEREQSVFTRGCNFGASGIAMYQRDLSTSVSAHEGDLHASDFPGGEAGFYVLPLGGGAIASGSTIHLPGTTFPAAYTASLTSCFHRSVTLATAISEYPEIWSPPTNGSNDVRLVGGKFVVSGSSETDWPAFPGPCVDTGGGCTYGEFPLVGPDFMISRVDTVRWSAREHALPQVELTGLEVNQAIQDLRGSVPLTEAKTTYVRAYPEWHGPGGTKTVSLELVGTRGGLALPGSPLQPVNGQRLAAAYYFRSSMAHSANFRLPPTWTRGVVELKVRIVGDETGNGLLCKEAAGTPDDCSFTANFQPVGGLQVRFVGVPWTDTSTGATYPAPDVQAAQQEAQRLKAILPTARVDWDYVPGTPASGAPFDPTVGVIPMWNRIKADLAMQKQRDGCGSTCHRVYLALVTDPPAGTLGGMANAIPGILAVVGHEPDGVNTFARETAAHEIGHVLGRHHTVDSALPLANGYKTGWCGEVASPTAPDWLDTIAVGGMIYPSITPAGGGTDRQIFGFDTVSADTDPTGVAGPVDPASHYELMSYCNGSNYSGRWNWISPSTYVAAQAWLNADFAPPAPLFRVATARADGYLLVRGQVDVVTGAVQFDPFARITSTTPPDAPPTGPYTIEVRDASGAVLSSTPFDAVPSHVDGSTGPAGLTTASFLVPVPDDDAAAQVVVVHAGANLGAVSASGHAPTVQVLSPAAGANVSGPLVVRWTAADADGDPLHFTIQLSRDAGNTWRTVAVDVTGSSYTIDESGLGASTNAIVRVDASDGFLTAGDSSGSFTIAGHAPVVAVGSPVGGTQYSADQSILLAATAYDVDEGSLAPGMLSWTIDGARVSGSGDGVVSGADLSRGNHTATVTAVDSSGRTVSERVLFSVGTAFVPVSGSGSTSSGGSPATGSTSSGDSSAPDKPTAPPAGTPSPPQPRRPPGLQIGGGALAPPLQLLLKGKRATLSASVTVDQPVTLRVTVLPARVILRGSVLAGVRSGRDHTALAQIVRAAGSVSFRLRITKAAAGRGPVTATVVATALDGSQSTVRLVFRH